MARLALTTSLLVALLSVLACGPRGYVVLRDVPMAPSFVVIAAGSQQDDVAFANRIEAVLIEMGLRVLSPPGLRKVETEQKQELGATKGSDALDRSVDLESRRREQYLSLADTGADYLIVLYDDPVRIKVTLKDTGEIIASVPWRGDQPLADELRALLGAAGVPVSSGSQAAKGT